MEDGAIAAAGAPDRERIHHGGERKADDRVLRMTLVGALEQTEIVAAHNGALDVQGGQMAIEHGKQS